MWILFFYPALVFGQLQPIVSFGPDPEGFPLYVKDKVAPILISQSDEAGVRRAASLLQSDLGKVSQHLPELYIDQIPKGSPLLVIVGVVGKNPYIDRLHREKKLDVSEIQGKWESFLIQTIDRPFPNVQKALVIAGSDKRGAIYGALEISSQIGVSPWYWWADVPVEPRSALYIVSGRHIMDAPKVKYRGIFINDEAPALSGWVHEKFGGFKHPFYEKVFELILRLKGNLLWPAMWGNAFYDDDPQNAVLADEYGVVISTSHHEPMMRAHDEWRRYGKGKWNYAENDSTLRQFWRESMLRTGSKESLVTIGMRGDGDEPMTQGTAIELLERIVADQRKILGQTLGKKPEEIPQVWALYKEVQDYYDQGMRVPDDVTLLLCDDNWGNIRKLPRLDSPPRSGGYGIYYHFDYVGGPRNYKWVNTNLIPRIWEQMHLAYQYRARQMWIVNVGDIKPMELPISFFLDQAWNPEHMTVERMEAYTLKWAGQQFPSAQAPEIARLLSTYTKYNARCKPELLSPETYSLDNYQEFESVATDYQLLARQAQSVFDALPEKYRDAYYQLVLYPILACANLYELYYTVALNRRYAAQGYAETNELADKAEALFRRDAELSDYFNRSLAGGKWNHFADQTHIGYTYWQQPAQNTMPKVERLSPEQVKGKAPVKTTAVPVAVSVNPEPGFRGYVESNGYISMEAAHFSRARGKDSVFWQRIPGIGRTGDGMTIFPVATPVVPLNAESPRLEFDFYAGSTGDCSIQAMLSPTLDFNENQGLHYALSIDDETPQVVAIHQDRSLKAWEKSVAQNIRIMQTRHHLSAPGKHTLKFWAINPGVVLQKLIVDCGGLKPSYLGPPESPFFPGSSLETKQEKP